MLVTTTVGLANNPFNSDQPTGLPGFAKGSYPFVKSSSQLGAIAVKAEVGPVHKDGGKDWLTQVPRTKMLYWV